MNSIIKLQQQTQNPQAARRRKAAGTEEAVRMFPLPAVRMPVRREAASP